MLTAGWTADAGAAENESSVKCPSPDGRFALRLSRMKDEDDGNYKVDLIERASGEVIVDLENAYDHHLADTVLVWSADSKKVAYGTRGYKQGETTIYLWNGSVFEQVILPQNMPSPKIRFGSGAGAVKNYGGAVKPLRWLKSGELELSNDLMMLSRVNGRSYTGTIRFTIRLDARHHPSVHQVSKTETRIDG